MPLHPPQHLSNILLALAKLQGAEAATPGRKAVPGSAEGSELQVRRAAGELGRGGAAGVPGRGAGGAGAGRRRAQQEQLERAGGRLLACMGTGAALAGLIHVTRLRHV